MYCGSDFSVSDNPENEIYTFDFVNDLSSGELLVDTTPPVWSIALASGTDASVATRLSGSPVIQNGPGGALTATSQRVVGLLPGVRYILQAVVTTNQGNKKSLYSHVLGNQPQ